MRETEPKTIGWCIVELMGHRKLGAHVREDTLAGAGFFRLDIYHRDSKEPVATQFVAPGSVYALTPTTERLARELAEACKVEPVSRWELPAPALPERTTDEPPITGDWAHCDGCDWDGPMADLKPDGNLKRCPECGGLAIKENQPVPEF